MDAGFRIESPTGSFFTLRQRGFRRTRSPRRNLNSNTGLAAPSGEARPPDARPGRAGARRGRFAQAGQSLTEALLALLLSLIVSGSALAVLQGTMGQSRTLMGSAQLNASVRSSMQMIARDVRRAGYTSGAMWCLANLACLPDVTVDLPLNVSLPLIGSLELPGGIAISEDETCITFHLDRDQDGNAGTDEFAGYRLVTADDTGVLETWMGTGAPACDGADSNWVAITDDRIVNVGTFRVDEDLSFDEVVATDLLGNTTTQRIRRIRVEIVANLTGSTDVVANLVSVIDVRNDILL